MAPFVPGFVGEAAEEATEVLLSVLDAELDAEFDAELAGQDRSKSGAELKSAPMMPKEGLGVVGTESVDSSISIHSLEYDHDLLWMTNH